MNSNKKFVFIAHWVEPWNWLLWFNKDLHKHPEHAWRWFCLAPICVIMSVVYLLGKKAHDVVDRFTFSGMKGETWLIRNFGWHFVLKKYADAIRHRIYQAVLLTQESGFSVIGLGALTKDESLTKGGALIKEYLGPKLKVPIVHGDTMTAAVVVEQAFALLEKCNLEGTTVFITGGTSKIGRAVALTLVEHDVRVMLYTQDPGRFQAIKDEAGKKGDLLIHSTSLKNGYDNDCLLWITGKAAPSGRVLKDFMPYGAVVLNFAVPDPFTPSMLRSRPDIQHFDGGLSEYDPTRTDLAFTMRLRPGLTYSCHAGVMIHCYMEWTHHEVGPVDLFQMPLVLRVGKQIGFTPAQPTSFLKPVALPSKQKSSTLHMRRSLMVLTS